MHGLMYSPLKEEKAKEDEGGREGGGSKGDRRKEMKWVLLKSPFLHFYVCPSLLHFKKKIDGFKLRNV